MPINFTDVVANCHLINLFHLFCWVNIFFFFFFSASTETFQRRFQGSGTTVKPYLTHSHHLNSTSPMNREGSWMHHQHWGLRYQNLFPVGFFFFNIFPQSQKSIFFFSISHLFLSSSFIMFHYSMFKQSGTWEVDHEFGRHEGRLFLTAIRRETEGKSQKRSEKDGLRGRKLRKLLGQVQAVHIQGGD